MWKVQQKIKDQTCNQEFYSISVVSQKVKKLWYAQYQLENTIKPEYNNIKTL